MPLPSHRPPMFCLILAEAVLLTPRGQRFFICLLKNLSLRGASKGLRVGSDVAIARHAFIAASSVSLKSQNRVLIVSPPMSFRTSGGGSAVGYGDVFWTLLALFNRQAPTARGQSFFSFLSSRTCIMHILKSNESWFRQPAMPSSQHLTHP